MGVFRDLFYVKDILIVVLIPVVLSPLLIVEDSPEAKCAYCVIIMAVFWITEAMPIAVTSLLPVFLFPIAGVLTVADAASQFMNDTNMLFIGGLVVAAAIEHWNIHRRIALRILMIVGAETRWLMLGLMAPTWFLSMWISNTATTAMMIPIANAVLIQLKQTEKSFKKDAQEHEALELGDIDIKDQTRNKDSTDDHLTRNGDVTQYTIEIYIPKENQEKKLHVSEQILDTKINVLDDDDDPSFKRLCKCITLSIAYSANVGGIGSLTGTGPNLVMKAALQRVYEHYGVDEPSPITFANWMAFGIPTSFCIVVIVWIWLQIWFIRSSELCSAHTDKERNARVKAVIRKEYEKLGPITFGQAAVSAHFLTLAVLWVTRDMGGEFGWGSWFKKGYVDDGAPAILVASSLFIFPSTVPRVFCAQRDENERTMKPLLSWRAAVHKVPWGVVFLLGGGFAMAHASSESGLSELVGEELRVLNSLSPWVLNLVLCYIVAIMTEVTSNSATCTLMMPILASLAINVGQNPMYVMFPTTIASSFAFMLPVATPPNAVVFSYGYVKVIDMVLCGFVLNIICVLVLIGFSESLGEHIFHYKIIGEELLPIFANRTVT
ncbi:hypothetical protein ACF0H5_011730 [Mactra antiquata]